MDFNMLNAMIAKLGADVSAEIDAAVAAINAAKGGDQSQLDAAVAALKNIDDAVNAAKEQFQAPQA